MSETSLSRPRVGFQLKVEPRLDVPRWLPLVVNIGAIVASLLIGAIILEIIGGNAWAAYRHIALNAFGSVGVLSDTMVKAIPLMMVGLALTVAFRMKLWNIGAEGQFFLGGFGASLVVLGGIVPETAPRWFMLTVMAIVGILCGAIWGFVPGILKARLRVNEIITTLMMNYIAISFNNYFIFAVWSEGGFQMSRTFERSAWLPRLADYASQVPMLRGLTTHAGLIIALLAAVVVWWILYRSRWGYEIKLIGDNPRAAQYSGINIVRNTVLVMMLSGGLAGLAGMSEVAGVVHRLQGNISPGYGFTGIIIAWLARLNPWLVIIVSILFGGLILAGREIQPAGVPRLIQGIILFAIIASEVLLRYRVRLVRPAKA